MMYCIVTVNEPAIINRYSKKRSNIGHTLELLPNDNLSLQYGVNR